MGQYDGFGRRDGRKKTSEIEVPLRDIFDVEFCGKKQTCRVSFYLTPALAATASSPYKPTEIAIEKIELVEIRKMNFGTEGSKNKDCLCKLDIFDWVDHNTIGTWLMANIERYEREAARG